MPTPAPLDKNALIARIGSAPRQGIASALKELGLLRESFGCLADFHAAAEQLALDLVRGQPDGSLWLGHVLNTPLSEAVHRLARKGILVPDTYISNVWKLAEQVAIAA